MYCRIVKHEKTGEEFLIPECFSVVHNCGVEGLTDRDIIKEYCSCCRPKREKYETKDRDQVFGIIETLKAQIAKFENDLEKMKEDLSDLEAEVFMLNTVEIYPNKP